MASECNNWRGVICLAMALTVLTGSGCRVFRRAPVEKPPTEAAAASPTEASELEEAEAIELGPPHAEEPEADEPLDAVQTDQAKAEVDVADEPVAAAPPRAEQTPKTAPSTEKVPPPEEKAEPPEPRLIHEEDEVSLESIQRDLARAERLSDVLADRALSAELRTQVESGREFLDDARDALEAEDLKRASVLLDKCLGLLEDAEYNSRP